MDVIRFLNESITVIFCLYSTFYRSEHFRIANFPISLAPIFLFHWKMVVHQNPINFQTKTQRSKRDNVYKPTWCLGTYATWRELNETEQLMTLLFNITHENHTPSQIIYKDYKKQLKNTSNPNRSFIKSKW